MHELGIAKDIFKQMQATAGKSGLKKVHKVVFKLGVLNGIEGDHMAEHLDEYAPGTAFEGTQYEFVMVSPGEELTASESPSGKPAAATGFEIIVISMAGE